MNNFLLSMKAKWDAMKPKPKIVIVVFVVAVIGLAIWEAVTK